MMKLTNDPIKNLAMAVVRQWLEDNKPDDDIEVWVEILKTLSDSDAKNQDVACEMLRRMGQ